ncbi:N(4)-(beta-N-acetylglucosaminyl)-L-asparaginase [Phenylobacterium sp.]|uniref:N(4)-(beta-N-acetylglucosaminyl)-L-asparaginase n=1 Tax=Phenylobacterium sp. TaxID=1871053 RepID=UPI0012173F50|nr:N(4)-(beta-N-acetylglucosaminyl)-L-asparaginase [Phenylobacterium sp.]THD63845.1 MAG: N(4)-(beta-N-acetylglucosaminyl)-L-asparaginase [Phenylobacterium sp.]
MSNPQTPTFDRRQLIAAGAGAAAVAGLAAGVRAEAQTAQPVKLSTPCVVSTWDFGVAANAAAWAVLSKGGAALDAVEAGARVPEADLKNHSVGRAGYPDRDGHVSLDASIMDQKGDCGAVAGLEHIAHPISVARRVMERTPHVLLVGGGALQFALEQGFPREELLTPESRKAWQAWLKEKHYKPVANSEVRTYGQDLGTPGGKDNHDTLGMLALDRRSDLSGACTTSGMAWKMRGRVGDSPIIGAGLYVDNEVGAATSTGVGEEVIRNVGSFLVVELMRQGRSPRDACREAVQRILRRNVTRDPDFQVGFLAVNKAGEVGAWAVQKGFSYACCDAQSQTRILQSESFS